VAAVLKLAFNEWKSIEIDWGEGQGKFSVNWNFSPGEIYAT